MAVAFGQENVFADGWIPLGGTFTYSSATAMTTGKNLSSLFNFGTKVRLKQGGGYKYGIVSSSSYSSPTLTVNLIQNSDYSLASAAITDVAISNLLVANSFPKGFTYASSPSSSAGTVTNINTYISRFSVIQGSVLLELCFDLQLTVAVAAYLTVGAPVAPKNTSFGQGNGIALQVSGTGSENGEIVGVNTGSLCQIYRSNLANWPVAAGHFVRGNFIYEPA